MADVNGNISLLFATEAYGMGADAPNIRRIIHYGPPTSVESKIDNLQANKYYTYHSTTII